MWYVIQSKIKPMSANLREWSMMSYIKRNPDAGPSSGARGFEVGGVTYMIGRTSKTEE